MKNKKTGSPLKWTYYSVKKQLPIVIVLVVLNSLLACSGTVGAVFSKYLIDGAVSKDLKTFLIFSIFLVSVFAFNTVFGAVNNYLTERCRASIEQSVKADFFQKITKKKFEDISAYHSGTLLNRLTSDISIIANCVTSILPSVVSVIIKLLCAFIVITMFEPLFALIFAVGGIFIFVATKLMRAKLKVLHKKVQEEDDKVRSFWQECLSNLLAVKVFSNENNMAEKSNDLQENCFKAKMKKAKFSAFTNVCYSGVMYLGYLFSFLWCATKLIYDSSFTYGSFTAIIQLVNQVQHPFSAMSGIIPQYYAAMASAERIMEIEDIEDEDLSKNIINVSETYSKLKSIEIKNLSFSYKRDKVFEDLNFKINKGDFVAILGHSGIGKSTLFKIILGVYSPLSGSVDLICDDEIIKCSNNTRKLFSYVPQGNLIFSGTIKENIMFVNSAVTEQQIQKALELSCVNEFVEKLPKGIDTVIGEKGLGLSEGQVQRIAIARALLSDAPILLLDEATSALDAVTETKVLQNLKNLSDKTCIFVTHRKQALSVCNKKWEITLENK
ncbi:MAG: ABC transporter ATP-binding protein [Acutalibacteraceae bacterium]